MCEMKHYLGIIRLIPRRVNETVEDLCKEIMNSNGYNELPYYCHSWIAYLSQMSNRIIYSKGELYEILKKDFIGTNDALLNWKKLKMIHISLKYYMTIVGVVLRQRLKECWICQN